VAGDSTLYRELWETATLITFKGSFVQQTVVEFRDAWRDEQEKPKFPTRVKFTLITGSQLQIDVELASIRGPLPWGDVAGKEVIAYFEEDVND